MKFKYILLFLFFSFLFSCKTTKNQIKLNVQKKFLYQFSSEKLYNKYWWKSFKNNELNRLINKAISENFDLKIALLRVKKAYLQFQKDKKILYPEIDSFISYSRKREKIKHLFKSTTNQYSLNLFTNYEIDVWGKLRSEINLSKLNFQEQIYYFDSAFITIISELTINYLKYVELTNKEKLVKEKLNIIIKKIKIFEEKYKSNSYSIADFLSAKQEYLNLKNSLNLIYAQKNIALNQIKLLLGKSTSFNLKIQSKNLPEIKLPMNIGLTSDLLIYRPDVKISFLKIKESFSKINIAKSERLPTFTFSSQILYSSTGNKILSIFDNWFYNFLTKIAYPLIDYNKRKLKQKIYELEKDSTIINYKKTVYNAIKEVEDAFLILNNDYKNIDNMKKIINDEKFRYLKLKDDYIFGKIDTIPLLNSKLLILNYKIQLLDLKLSYLTDLINLYKACGGIYYNEL